MKAASELARTLEQLDARGMKKLSRAELRELPALYRNVVSDLAEARARGLPAQEARRLEALVLRGHAILYAPDPPRLGGALAELLREFPHEVRRSLRPLALAMALFLSGGVLGYAEVQRDPASAAVLLPGALGENAEESFQPSGPARDGDPLYGALYFTNNARVALNTYALGASFGVGTVLMLLFNGTVIGATIAVVAAEGSTRAFWSFVLPHGGIEIAAISFAAAGGLRIGAGMLFPGSLPRGQSLARAARASLPLALGAALVLAVAGLVEGWISPLPFSLAGKAALGIGLDLALLAYLLIGQRAWRRRPAGVEGS
jgi:uncharacterized membrane protein SpoIIM required for sporulation